MAEVKHKTLEILVKLLPLIILGSIAVSFGIVKYEQSIKTNAINENRPYKSQLVNLNGDSIPDLRIYSKNYSIVDLIGLGNGEFYIEKKEK